VSLRELVNAATPGPWGWFGHRGGDMYLATPKGGRRFVMTFKRKGMRGAEPSFQVYTDRSGEPWEWDGLMTPATDLAVQEVEYRDDIIGIDHPDARLIALAPELAVLLADAMDALRKFLAMQHDPYCEWLTPEDANALLARYAALDARAGGEET
jgi:hypothetical protein